MAKNLEILAYDITPLGPLCLRRRTLLSNPGTIITEVTLNHAFLMSSHNTVSERALSSVALGLHPGTNLRVLIGGLGLGYTADEALASDRVAKVEAVEFLPQVIAWLENDLVPLSPKLKADKRFTTISGDLFAMLDESPGTLYDLILIDIDHSPDGNLSQANRFFYTPEGLERASRHLTPGGFLGVWSCADSPTFTQALQSTFVEVSVTPVAFHNDLFHEEATDWLFFGRKKA